MSIKRLEGKVSLITGAGNGMGQAMTRLLLKKVPRLLPWTLIKIHCWEGVENVSLPRRYHQIG